MRNQYRCIICLLFLTMSSACRERKDIDPGKDAGARTSILDKNDKVVPMTPASSPGWKAGSPFEMQGHWVTSLFQDQRCTAFYTFLPDATAELNVLCLNADKKQFEREHRRYEVAQYPGTQQIRLKQTDSSCLPSDTKTIGGEGVSLLVDLDSRLAPDLPPNLVISEPNVGKQALNLSQADGLLMDGFPSKTGSYLGMPLVDGCFGDGLVANFVSSPRP